MINESQCATEVREWEGEEKKWRPNWWIVFMMFAQI